MNGDFTSSRHYVPGGLRPDCFKKRKANFEIKTNRHCFSFTTSRLGWRTLQEERQTASQEQDPTGGLFVCGISLTSGQLFNELFPDCTRSCFSQVVLRSRGGERIYEMRCLFVAVGPNARFIVLPHCLFVCLWD